MPLGEAIGPGPKSELESALRSAVEGVLQEKGAAAAALREIIEQQTAMVTRLGAATDQLAAAAESLSSASRSLASRTTMPAPQVTVEVPTPSVSVDAPSVQVDAPVTVNLPAEEQGPEREILTVQRNADGLITQIIKTHG